MTLRVIAPAASIEDMRALIPAGADEFYAGLMTREVIERYTNVFSLNVRHVSKASFRSFEELEEAIEFSHSNGKPFNVTFNAHYLDDQYTMVLEQIERVISLGADALMIGDIALFTALRGQFPGMDVHISTMAGTMNQETARFFEDLGASRIILPRGLTIEEINTLQAGATKVKFEVFIMSERDVFSNALCHWEHSQYEALRGPLYKTWEGVKRRFKMEDPPMERPSSSRIVQYMQERMIERFGPPCFCDYEAEVHDTKGQSKRIKHFKFYRCYSAFRDACGACAVYDLSKMGNIAGLKIVGRNHPTSKKVKDTKIIRDVIKALESEPGKEEFVKEAKAIRRRYYPGMCEKWYCYYP